MVEDRSTYELDPADALCLDLAADDLEEGRTEGLAPMLRDIAAAIRNSLCITQAEGE